MQFTKRLYEYGGYIFGGLFDPMIIYIRGFHWAMHFLFLGGGWNGPGHTLVSFRCLESGITGSIRAGLGLFPVSERK